MYNAIPVNNRLKRLVKKHLADLSKPPLKMSLNRYAVIVRIPQQTLHKWLHTRGRCLREPTAKRLEAYLDRRGYK